MRRIAAHYVYWKELLPLHVVEMDDNNILLSIYPLKEELPGTEFWDGVIYPISAEFEEIQHINSLEELVEKGIASTVEIGMEVILHRLPY